MISLVVTKPYILWISGPLMKHDHDPPLQIRTRPIQFRGIDSRMQLDVGGTNYEFMRIGTLMGQKMMYSMAAAMLSRSLLSSDEATWG